MFRICNFATPADVEFACTHGRIGDAVFAASQEKMPPHCINRLVDYCIQYGRPHTAKFLADLIGRHIDAVEVWNMICACLRRGNRELAVYAAQLI